MQDIIVERPYAFIPPHRGKGWPWIIQRLCLVEMYLKRFEGVHRYSLRGVDHLRESMRLGHGVLLTPNHCRYADPMVMGVVARDAKTNLYAMASWHLFQKSQFQRWAIRTMGGFSLYREGIDRQSLDTAVEILSTAERPLVLFPEGAVFRTNDRLQALLDGVAFIARTAAKRRLKEDPNKSVVIHPVAIKYLFHGDLKATVEPVLDAIERRLTWTHSRPTSLIERIHRVITGLLSLKEIEYFGTAQLGTVQERQQRLVDRLLDPLEIQWIGKKSQDAIIPRVKNLRFKIIPAMIAGEVEDRDRRQRWKNLADIYLAQQIASYPHDYLDTPTTVTRVLETVERLEEDLTDRSRVHRPLEAVVEIGAPIAVPTERGPRGEEDPIMSVLRDRLQSMLNGMAGQSDSYQDG